jgi:hypothetical protein
MELSGWFLSLSFIAFVSSYASNTESSEEVFADETEYADYSDWNKHDIRRFDESDGTIYIGDQRIVKRLQETLSPELTSTESEMKSLKRNNEDIEELELPSKVDSTEKITLTTLNKMPLTKQPIIDKPKPTKLPTISSETPPILIKTESSIPIFTQQSNTLELEQRDKDDNEILKLFDKIVFRRVQVQKTQINIFF